MNTYTPDSNRVIHYANVDFTTRNFIDTVHLVQYDNKLPILAVRMFQNGTDYDVSDADRVQLRYGKRDRTFVVLDTVGTSEGGSIVFFELTDQITVEDGEHNAVIDVIFEQTVMNNASSPIPIIVDKNPVTADMVESLTDYKALVQYRNEALEYKDSAYESAMYLLEYLQNGYSYQFVDELPSDPDKKTVYLILKAGETDKYNQWVYGRDNQWHLIGTSQVSMEDKIHIEKVTIPTSSWSDYPYTVTIPVGHVLPTSWVFIVIDTRIYETYEIVGTDQQIDSLTFTAYIKKPTEDIDVDILVMN